MFKEHMFYKELLKEAKFRLKTSKVDHDTLVTKTQEEKLGFEVDLKKKLFYILCSHSNAVFRRWMTSSNDTIIRLTLNHAN